MMEDFKIKTVSKREVKERFRKYHIEGNIKGKLDLKEELRNILGETLGNRMYEDCKRKAKEELNV